MSEKSIFGTDGVRGPAGEGILTALECLRLGATLTSLWTGERPSIALARDTRQSGALLASSVAAGISAAGGTPLDFGVLPTPALALLVESLPDCVAGLMITASHNPWPDNGLKFFGADGHKLGDARQEQLERAYRNARDAGEVPGAGCSPGVVEDRAAWAHTAYVDALVAGARCRLDGLRLVVDHASGAAATALSEVLLGLGAEVVEVAPAPNGRNINEGTGAVHPQLASEAVKSRGAWGGVVVDGDGDRIFLIDECGTIHDGDAILGALAGAMQVEGTLRGGGVVGTVTTGAGLESFLGERGLGLVRTPVGDRHVAEAMDRGGFNLGGEASGHVLTPDSCPSGDGSRVAIDVIGRAVSGNFSLADLLGAIPRFPVAHRRVDAGTRPSLAALQGLQAVLREADEALHMVDGRQLVRYSGTEPILRVQVEGKHADRVEAWADRIAAAAAAAIAAAN